MAAHIPVAGRSFAAVRDTAAAASAVVDAAEAVVTAVDVTSLLKSGGFDLETVDRMHTALVTAADSTAAPLRRLRRLRTGLTPGPVKDGVGQAKREIGSLDTSFRAAAALVDALSQVAGKNGPQPVLFALQNNAELRGTGGLISIFAEGTADKGRFRLKRFRDVEDVADQPLTAKKVAAPADYERIYGPQLANTTVWKNANMSPDGPSSWSVLAGIAEVSLKRKPTAVVVIDVPAVAGILGATGPAQLPDGRTISADNAVSELLVKSYEGVPDTFAGQTERRRRLRVAADAVIARLLTTTAPPLPLLRALQLAAAGRHIMVWSADPVTQQALVASGVAGAVPTPDPDIAMMTVHNLGAGRPGEGNKLDYYATRTVKITVTVGAKFADTTQQWTLRNNAPEGGLSGYVGGTLHPGRTNNQVRFALPPDATLTAYDRDGVARPAGDLLEAGSRLLSDVASLEAGTATTWTIRYRVPLKGRSYRMWLVPQPVVQAPALTLRISAAEGTAVRPRGGTGASYDGAWSAVLHPGVDVPRAGWWRRTSDGIKRWWTEPVHIG